MVAVEMESEGVFIHLLGDDVTSSRWHFSIARTGIRPVFD
jgi:hypothetical protein